MTPIVSRKNSGMWPAFSSVAAKYVGVIGIGANNSRPATTNRSNR
jgi:hypothetical protein